MMNRIIKASEFARVKHAGQLRDDGKPYITHLQQVAEILSLVSMDSDLVAAGWLHDTLEDTDTTYNELVKEFNKKIADLVFEVTQEGQKDNYGYYFPNLKTKDGILLKFADRLSNLSQMDTWNEKRRQHYLKKSKFWRDSGGKNDEA